jgi:hypothetical protein
MKRIALFLFAAILSGCASYTPPNMSKNQMAQIRETKIGSAYITIERIDGIVTDSFAKEMGFSNPFKKDWWLRTADDVFDIKPGRRVLVVMFERNGGFAYGRVAFIAEAGKSYYVTGFLSELDESKSWWQANPQYVSFAVKDDATGKIVSEEN